MWRRRVAGPHAISVWTALAPLPLLLAVRPMDPVVRESTDVPTYLFATVVGQAAVALGAWLAWKTVLRPDRTSFKVWVAVAVFATLGMARVVTIAAVETATGLQISRTLPGELVVGALQGLVVLSLVAAVVNTRRDYVAANQRLREARARIQAVEATDREAAENTGRQLLNDIAEEVARRLQTIDAASPDAAPLPDQVRSLSSEFVRPLSHQIEREWDRLMMDAVVATPAVAMPQPSLASRSARLVGDVTRSLQPPEPLVVTLLMSGIAVPALIRFFGPTVTAAMILPSAMILFGGTTLLGRLMRREQGRPFVLAILLVIGAMTTAALTSVWNHFIVRTLTGTEYNFAETLIMFTFLCVGASLAATAGLLAARYQDALLVSLQEEVAAGEALARNVAGLRRATANYLHSSVQGELFATALQLQAVAPGEQDAVLRAAAQRVMAGIQEVQSADPRDVLGSQLQFWQTAAGVRSDVAPTVWAVLQRRPGLAEAVSQVLSEALTNAVKHGTAESITVHIALDDEQSPRSTGSTAQGEAAGVIVEVTNTGTLPRRNEPAGGLGLRHIADLTESLEFSAADGSVRLRAVVVA